MGILGERGVDASILYFSYYFEHSVSMDKIQLVLDLLNIVKVKRDNFAKVRVARNSLTALLLSINNIHNNLHNFINSNNSNNNSVNNVDDVLFVEVCLAVPRLANDRP